MDAAGHHHHHHHHQNETNKVYPVVVVLDDNQPINHDDHDHVLLKERIVSHPLYDLLLHAHLNIFKVTLGDIEEEILIKNGHGTIAQSVIKEKKKLSNIVNTNPIMSPDLDNFMENYCNVLEKLKEEMEKPMQETTDFIEAMYSELNSIVGPSSNSTRAHF